MRLTGRFIPRRSIVDSHADYEIIEEYPEDKYLPSYLVHSEYGGDVFHILFAVDIWKKTMFGSSRPIVPALKNGKNTSRQGDVSHAVPCVWIEIETFGHGSPVQGE